MLDHHELESGCLSIWKINFDSNYPIASMRVKINTPSVECSSWVKYHLVLSPRHSARVHKTFQKCNSPTQSLSAKTFTSSAIGMSRSLLGILSQILWRCNFGSLVQVQVYGLTKKEWGWVKHFRLLVYVFFVIWLQ